MNKEIKKFKINKSKCVDCQVCLETCPGATKIRADGKAEIIDQEKLEQCGGEDVCPIGAIEEISNEANTKQSKTPLSPLPSSPTRGRGLGMGRGMGAGGGRGLGRGPRDGRGGGRGGGGRRR